MERKGEHTGVEEHVAHSGGFAVYLEGVAAQHDAFGDDTGRVRVQEAAHGDQLRRCVHCQLE